MKNIKQIITRKSSLDQFYTSPEAAEICYKTLLEVANPNVYDICVEPSAGTGNLFKLLPEANRLGMDLQPKMAGIIEQNFYNYIPELGKKYLAFTNPPFGKNCKESIGFFNKLAEFCDIIAIIQPITARRYTYQNKLNLNMHLVKDIDLPKKSFILNDQPYHVKCCYQIWQKSDIRREKIKYSTENEYFTFISKKEAERITELNKPDLVDNLQSKFLVDNLQSKLLVLAIRRVGSKAGTCYDYNDHNPNSFLFVKTNCQDLKDVINGIKFDNTTTLGPSNLTVGMLANSVKTFFSMEPRRDLNDTKSN